MIETIHGCVLPHACLHTTHDPGSGAGATWPYSDSSSNCLCIDCQIPAYSNEIVTKIVIQITALAFIE
jgi:hypothetical protein